MGRQIILFFLLSCSASFYACGGGGGGGGSGKDSFVTYYVSPAGSDGGNGTAGAPFRTIQKAADIVNPGDTVIVRDGTYTDTDNDNALVVLDLGGTSDARITFKAENKWGAVLDCRNNTTGYGWINSTNASHVTIEGFEIKGCAAMGINSSSGSNNHDININKNYIHHIGRKANNSVYGSAGIFAGQGTYNFTIDSNLLHDIGRLNPYTTPSAAESTCTTGTGAIVCYNNDHAMYLYGRNNTLMNNTVYGTESGWALQIAGGASPDGPDWNITNNTFYGMNTQRDGQIVIWAAYSLPTNILIQNNISFGARNAFVSASKGSLTWSLKNNLVYGATLISGTTDYTASGNIIGQDPKFKNLAGRDFHLLAGSPAINQGLDAGLTYDADGNPVAGVRDIGAYEYIGGGVTLSHCVY